jgi:hypothetical protein
MPKPTDKNFLVYISDGYFLEFAHGSEITGTKVMSRAHHFDYHAADAKCQSLWRRGHRAALVTDNLGNPIEESYFQTAK